jgi:hypothetical protein
MKKLFAVILVCGSGVRGGKSGPGGGCARGPGGGCARGPGGGCARGDGQRGGSGGGCARGPGGGCARGDGTLKREEITASHETAGMLHGRGAGNPARFFPAVTPGS